MLVNDEHLTTIWYEKKTDTVKIIDQRLIPFDLQIIELNTVDEVCFAIKEMQVRGAPLIGVTAAYGMYIASKENANLDFLQDVSKRINATRPTAVNLSWALNEVLTKIADLKEEQTSAKILEIANQIRQDDIDNCKKIGEYGCELIKKIYAIKNKPVNILTHCNAGWLATVDWGTALAPVFVANKNNIPVHVWVDETRPRNQGFSLTAWELINEKIPNSLIVDNVGGHLMQHNQIDICITGTDRTASNGDVCNKIGTYLKALAAYDNNIPFYVSAPISSIDFNIKNFQEQDVSGSGSYNLLGTFNDLYFGQSDAAFFMQVLLPSNNIDFEASEEPNIKLELSLPYYRSYGDTLQNLNLSVLMLQMVIQKILVILFQK